MYHGCSLLQGEGISRLKKEMSNKSGCCVGAASQSWKTTSSGRNPACVHKKIVIKLRWFEWTRRTFEWANGLIKKAAKGQGVICLLR